MEDFYDILVFNRLLSKLFEPETALPIELQLNDITRQIVWECSQRGTVSRSSTGHRVAKSRRKGAPRQARSEAAAKTP